MTTAATLVTVNTGHSANDGTGSTIKDAFDLINNNINKLNFQLNSDGINSSQYPGTYLTLTKDFYANAGTIQGATIKGSAIFVNGSPVLTSATGNWAGGTIPYYGIFANTDPSTSTTTGVVQVAGGVGIQGNLNLGGLLTVTGNTSLGNITVGGKFNVGTINTTGTASFNQLVVAAGSTLSGTTLFAGPSTYNGIPTYNAASVFNNDATFFANLNLSGSINGNGAINLYQATLSSATVANVTVNAGLQAKAIGNVTPGTAIFSALGVGGRITSTNTQPTLSTTSAAVVLAGGMGIGGDVIIGGNLTVSGATTTVNTEIINQAVVVAATITANTVNATTIGNVSANIIGTGRFLTSLSGGNITAGTIPTNALINSNIAITTGYGIGSNVANVALGDAVNLTNTGVTSLIAGTGIAISSATGNITVTATSATITPVFANIGHSGTSGVGDIGSSANTFGTVYAIATSAKYADVAELYTSDADYEPGTVVAFGGSAEITIAEDSTRRVAGVVSTDPAYLMNSHCESEFKVAVALQGRVPVKVRGNIEKGDMLISAGSGFARAEYNPILGSVIGKALEDFNGVEGVIEVVVGRL
jgi:hypothetical protein